MPVCHDRNEHARHEVGKGLIMTKNYTVSALFTVNSDNEALKDVTTTFFFEPEDVPSVTDTIDKLNLSDRIGAELNRVERDLTLYINTEELTPDILSALLCIIEGCQEQGIALFLWVLRKGVYVPFYFPF